jgi:hypothetical protein
MSSGKYKTCKPWAWRKVSRVSLDARPLCAMCLERGQLTPAALTDHVIPHRGNPGRFWRGETQSLCWSCHSALKQSQESGAGYHCAVDANGWFADPEHPSNVVDSGTEEAAKESLSVELIITQPGARLLFGLPGRASRGLL